MRHAAVDYRVYALGFSGGFPFLGEVDPVIRSPRLELPRERVAGDTVRFVPSDGVTPAKAAALELLPSQPKRLRLEGSEVAGGGVLSKANPLGAVQLTASGVPLVLINDRGTRGGYDKPAIVHPMTYLAWLSFGPAARWCSSWPGDCPS